MASADVAVARIPILILGYDCRRFKLVLRIGVKLVDKIRTVFVDEAVCFAFGFEMAGCGSGEEEGG